MLCGDGFLFSAVSWDEVVTSLLTLPDSSRPCRLGWRCAAAMQKGGTNFGDDETLSFGAI